MPQFEPGNSGGPGRPKQKPFLDWCKKWIAEKGESFLAPIAENAKSKNQLEAIKLIFAYGIGKPAETVENSFRFEGMATDVNSVKEYLDTLITDPARGGVIKSSGSSEISGAGTA